MFDLPYNLNIPLMLYHSKDRLEYFSEFCSIEFSITFEDSLIYNFRSASYPFKIEINYSSSKQMFEDLYLVDNGELDLPQFILSHGKNLLDLKDSMDEYALENDLGKFWETVNSEMKNIVVQEFS